VHNPRPKYYFRNWKINSVAIGCCAVFGLVMSSTVVVSGFEEWEQHGDGPTQITADELVSKGPPASRFIQVTDLQVGPEYWQTKPKHGPQRCWVAIAPVADTPLFGPTN